MSDSTAHSYSNQGGRLSAILKAHGAGFVLVRSPGGKYTDWRTGEQRTAKGKEPLGAGWQHHPKSLSDAGKWAQGGGNVGLLGGHNNLILLDADAGADQVLAAEPRLRETVRIFRRNAPDRAKWIVRIVGTLPPSKKAHGIIEVLAAGTQGVIVGTHETGARIEYDGDQIVTLTGDDIRRLWRTLTGEELGHAARKEEAAPPDAAAVQRGVTLAESVLDLAGVKRTGWKEYQGGRLVELDVCPFVERTTEPTRQHSTPHKSFVYVATDGRINAGCHSARCQHAIAEHGASGWSLLKEIAGYQPHQVDDLAHVRTVIDHLREWVRRTDLAEHVPLTKQAANGYRTQDTDRFTLDAILDQAHEHGRLTGLLLPVRKLRGWAGLGSPNTAGDALDRLQPWFVVEEQAADAKPGDARSFAIHPSLIAWAEEQIEVAYIAHSGTSGGDPVDQSYTRAMYATSPLVTHRTRDAFTSSQRPISEEALQARIDARQELIDAGEDVKPIERSRYRRRLEALFPSAGRAVLRMIDALVSEGGQADRRTLRTLLNLKSDGLSRAVSRAKELGLVDADRRIVVLHQQWRDLVDAFEPYMPSAGRRDDRLLNDLDVTIKFAQMQLRADDLTPKQEWRLLRRIARAKRQKQEIAARLRPDLEHRHADQAAPSLHEFLTRQRLADYHAQARIDLAAERRADDWRLPAEVQRLRNDGLSKRDAWRMLEMGGWKRGEVAGVMAVCWPSKVSA
jgi:hypothetical protein